MATDKDLKHLGLTNGAVKVFREQGWDTLEDMRLLDVVNDRRPWGRTATLHQINDLYLAFTQKRSEEIAAYNASIQARKLWQSQYRQRMAHKVDFNVRLRFRLPDMPKEALSAEAIEMFIRNVLTDYAQHHPDPRYHKIRISVGNVDPTFKEMDNDSAL